MTNIDMIFSSLMLLSILFGVFFLYSSKNPKNKRLYIGLTFMLLSGIILIPWGNVSQNILDEQVKYIEDVIIPLNDSEIEIFNENSDRYVIHNIDNILYIDSLNDDLTVLRLNMETGKINIESNEDIEKLHDYIKGVF